jgi:hypothetical protein
MGKIILLPVSIPEQNDIVQLFIDTPELHAAVNTVLSDNQLTSWQNGDADYKHLLLRYEAMRISEINEKAFFMERTDGLILAFAYIKGDVWNYRILEENEQEKLTVFLRTNVRTTPNIHEVPLRGGHGTEVILKEITQNGYCRYTADEKMATVLNDEDDTEIFHDMIQSILDKHFVDNNEKDPFVICDNEGNILLICAALSKFNTVMYERIPESARQSIKNFLETCFD